MLGFELVASLTKDEISLPDLARGDGSSRREGVFVVGDGTGGVVLGIEKA